MEIMLLLLILVLLGLVAGIFLYLKSKFEMQKPQDNNQALLMLQNQLNELSRVMDNKLSESVRAAHSSESARNELIRNVSEHLTRLQESNKQVLTFTDQLRNLQDILKNPKQRGILGEYFLETLLKNAFQPKQYEMQYKFGDGEIVDAIIRLGDKIIPIDSKFSLENYNRIIDTSDPTEREALEKTFKQDLKNRIDETSKYIRPEEGTTEFAFMFIPAEGIYYDLLINKVGAVKVNTRDLIDYAINEKKVHIVSPTTFYVTLQSMWQGMRAYQIQESTKEILKNVGTLSRHLKAYNDYFSRLGNNLSTTVNAYNLAQKELAKVEKDVLRVGGESIGIENQVLDKPQTEGE
jgi:DNA recombination protein RmuC